MITVSQIVPRHTKDNQTMIVSEFYLTADHCLLLKGFCSKCHEEVNLLIPIEELDQNCPVEGFTIKDISDLHQMGIGME